MKISGYNEKFNIAGDRIKEARKLADLSQSKLAAKMQLKGICITQKAISRLEKGERIITDYEIIAFSEVLNVSIAYLLHLE